jgi:uncharacterized protein YvpB
MKLNVPFYTQTTLMGCGPAALKMAVDYLGTEIKLKDIENAMGIEELKAVATISLAGAAAKLGFNSILFTKTLDVPDEQKKMPFYQKYADSGYFNSARKRVEIAEKAGAKINEITIDLKKLLSYVKESQAVIVLLNWAVINHKEGFQGHFVPIVGYDETYVYVHNSGPKDPEADVKIPVAVFETARKSPGTDQDVVVISKK